MLGKFTKSSKIPVRDTRVQDLKPMFDIMHHQRSRKETFSASFNAPEQSAAAAASRSKSVEKNQKTSEKNKELKQLISSKDIEIHDLRNHNEKLLEENANLRRDKAVILESYNSLLENAEESAEEDKNKFKFLENSNAEMKNDLKMMKILVFRLNKHIEYYQEILNEKEIKFDAPTSFANEDESSATTWAIHTNILSPLMDSYEERIKEKNEIIKSYETELSLFTNKIKKVFEENEHLQEQFENLSKNTEVWRTEKQRLTSQCEILKNKASIHAKRADLAKEKLYEVLKVYEQKTQLQAIDIERLQEAYHRSKGEIASLKNLHKTPDIVTQQVEECQKFLSDLRNQFEIEKNQLLEEKRDLDAANRQLRIDVSELQTLLEKQKLCNEALNDKNKVLKKTLQQERQSCENLEKDANQFREYGRDSWQNISDLQNQLYEKEQIIQSLKFAHEKEIEEFQLKLQQRDHTLRKVLEAKIAQASTKC